MDFYEEFLIIYLLFILVVISGTFKITRNFKFLILYQYQNSLFNFALHSHLYNFIHHFKQCVSYTRKSLRLIRILLPFCSSVIIKDMLQNILFIIKWCIHSCNNNSLQILFTSPHFFSPFVKAFFCYFHERC